MLDEADAACYPVRLACRVASVCSKPLPPLARKTAPRFKELNEYSLMSAECGCRLLPVPIWVEFGVEKVICDVHGPTRITKPNPPKKSKRSEVEGQEEIPPF